MNDFEKFFASFCFFVFGLGYAFFGSNAVGEEFLIILLYGGGLGFICTASFLGSIRAFLRYQDHGRDGQAFLSAFLAIVAVSSFSLLFGLNWAVMAVLTGLTVILAIASLCFILKRLPWAAIGKGILWSIVSTPSLAGMLLGASCVWMLFQSLETAPTITIATLIWGAIIGGGWAYVTARIVHLVHQGRCSAAG